MSKHTCLDPVCMAFKVMEVIVTRNTPKPEVPKYSFLGRGGEISLSANELHTRKLTENVAKEHDGQQPFAFGYSKLAAFMTGTHYPIVKKYQHLAVLDLLYLQAELCELDHKLKTVSKQDALQTDERQYFGRDWQSLQSPDDQGVFGDQWVLVLAMRAKLREYYNAISQYSQIASVPQPNSSERSLLHEWINSPAMGGGCGFLGRDLGGHDQLSVYDAMQQKDLAILSDAHGEDDLFTNFVTGPLLTLYHSLSRRRRKPLPIDPENPPVGDNQSSLHHYNDRHIEVVTNVLGIVFSSAAPLLSIVILSFVSSHRARLGLICTFTILFSACLAVATKARRVEIFAASAAFASVQVVFIGSTNTVI